MSRSAIERVECDRCGGITAFDDPDAAAKADWSSISVASLHGKTIIGDGQRGPADLCPSCLDELARWFKAGKDEANGQAQAE